MTPVIVQAAIEFQKLGLSQAFHARPVHLTTHEVIRCELRSDIFLQVNQVIDRRWFNGCAHPHYNRVSPVY